MRYCLPLFPGSNFSWTRLNLVPRKVLHNQHRGGSKRNETDAHTTIGPLGQTGMTMSAQDDQVYPLLFNQLMQRGGDVIADENARLNFL